MAVRWGRCEDRLRLRGLTWANRAKRELLMWPRSWFGTLTLSQPMHLRAEQHARMELGQAGEDFDALSPMDQFAARHRVISRWLTLWANRIKKQGEASLRLLVVCEPHTGEGTNHMLPHYHALIHETVAFATSERDLRHQWRYGFSKFTVVDLVNEDPGKAGWYVAKYLSKSTSARVRASVAYGELDHSLHQAPTPAPDKAIVMGLPEKTVA